ncbi:MAG: CHAT domain-containing protein [Oscillospiraceae bacterium]|nr:CHAT domain-containing protein [Oscillospiraceae bacterium]
MNALELYNQYREISGRIQNGDDPFTVISDAANYYADRYGMEEAVSFLEKLCEMSRKRSTPGVHQKIVAISLNLLADVDPDVTASIAEENERYFTDSDDELAGDFYWAYANVMQVREDYDAAVELYKRCYEIRKELYGEYNWYTLLPKRDVSALSYLFTHNEEDYEFLVTFVNSIENDVYDFSEDYFDTAKVIEGKTLYVLLSNLNQIDDLDEYRYLLTLYGDITEQYEQAGEPLITTRLYKNYLGTFYFTTGDYIRAETAYNEALEAKSDPEVPEILSDAMIRTNLLLIYYAQNDLEMAGPLLGKISKDIDNGELSLKDTYRVLSLEVSLYSQSLVGLSDESKKRLKEYAMDVCRDIIYGNPEMDDCICEVAGYVGSCLNKIVSSGLITKDDLRTCYRAMEIAYNKALPQMNVTQRISLGEFLAILSQSLGEKKSGSYFGDAIRLIEGENLPLTIRLEVLRTAGAYYCSCGYYATGIQYTMQALNEIDSIWKSYIRYLNDDRLLNILSPIQLNFTNCYSTLRRFQDVSAAYESVLRFKALASLAGRERNRLMHQSGVRQDLMAEIRTLQDRLSALENAGTFSDTEAETNSVKAELRSLEAEFAGQFGLIKDVTDVTWEKVRRAIPDNCVVLEFIYCTLTYNQTQFDLLGKDPEAGVDIYIIRKRSGDCRLDKVTVKDGMNLLGDAEEFVEIIQDVSENPEKESRLEELRKSLYDRLVKPVLSYVEGFDRIYIAPDSFIVNLPIEILYGDEQIRLDDGHSVVRIECARDFLYGVDSEDSSSGDLIIGNPAYDVRSQDKDTKDRSESDFHRSVSLGVTSVSQLPFASIEAERISRISGSPSYTGLLAGKNLLLSDRKYRNIHIATHGMFDLSQNTNSMFSSYLLFAGADNWFETGKIDEIYGNGIVTADEVSRLDLHSTELVVLSSCLSGMSDVSISRSFHGMISAFSAAGVHYVITHLWEATDFSTAVLMDEFYRQYLGNKKSPPEALRLAKEYLRTVTIGELRRNNWFEDIRREKMDPAMREIMSQYERLDDRRRPFRSEAYWGGFSCYQCY